MFKHHKILILKKHLLTIAIILFFTLLNSCKPFYNSTYKKPQLVDSKPSKQVKKLHKKLFYISKKGFAVGHQDATSYGIGWKQADFPDIIKSDVNDILGDFPAVYGFDIGRIEHSADNNLDDIPFTTMRNLIIDAYSKGGIITISWHLDNPTTDSNSWDITPATKFIIGKGKELGKYNQWVDRVANFLKSLTYKGKPIPIILRPFHEMNGSWFWWGKPNSNDIEYIQLWRNFVYSLRDNYKIHNILYAYSPNKLGENDNYLEFYPGDDFVDILGIDIYDFNNSEDYITSVVNDLKIVKDIATSRNKLYAFTETGLEKIPTNNWFTEVLYPNIENTGIAWILFWRNHIKTHHYMPYKGHSSEEDLKTFQQLPKTLFLKDINNIKF